MLLNKDRGDWVKNILDHIKLFIEIWNVIFLVFFQFMYDTILVCE